MQIKKLIKLFMLTVLAGALLSGCDLSANGQENTNSAQLKTRATVSTDLVASEYIVDVTFKSEAENQPNAIAVLESKIKPFQQWIKNKAYMMKGGTANLSGIYQYNPNEKRKLVAYEALQRFTITGLNFSEYQAVMKAVPNYQPFNLELQNVIASEESKSDAKKRLIEKAFAQTKEKASAMAKVAALCNIRVTEMTEHVQDHGAPRMMKMSMAEDSMNGAMHESESKQSMKLTLNVNWLATPC